MKSVFKVISFSLLAAVAALGAKESRAQAFTTALMDSYSCSDATYGTSGTYWDEAGAAGALYASGSRSTYTSNCTSGHTSNSAGSVVTAATTLRAAVSQTVGIVSARIANVKTGGASINRPGRVALTALHMENDRSAGEFGLSGGDTMDGMGVWGQGQFVRMDNSNSAQDSDGNIYTVMMGFDKNFAKDKGLAGLALGYQRGDITTTFNSGKVESDAFTISPYLSYSIDKTFSIDATVGFARVNYDNTRADSATSEKFTGSTNGDRLFGSALLNAQTRKDKVVLGGKLGMSYTTEKQDAFTETGATGTTVAVGSQTVKLGQAVLGGSVTYDGKTADPFINLTGEYDYSKTKATVASNQVTPSDDDFGLRVGAGINLDLGKNMSAMIEGNTVLLRSKYKEHTGTVRFRAEF